MRLLNTYIAGIPSRRERREVRISHKALDIEGALLLAASASHAPLLQGASEYRSLSQEDTVGESGWSFTCNTDIPGGDTTIAALTPLPRDELRETALAVALVREADAMAIRDAEADAKGWMSKYDEYSYMRSPDEPGVGRNDQGVQVSMEVMLMLNLTLTLTLIL